MEKLQIFYIFGTMHNIFGCFCVLLTNVGFLDFAKANFIKR